MHNSQSRSRIHGIAVTVVAIVIFIGESLTMATTWPPVGGPPITSWGKEVSADKPVLPEYPRPQLVREQWLNLNGQWDYAITPREGDVPAKFDGKILVPFCPQSVLSQVNRWVDDKSRIWYRRTMEIPPAWTGQRVLLNFGAVNWESHVLVNGKEVGSHTGGYDGFSFDITDALTPAGPQEIVVWAYNPIEGGQPRGKQASKPDGIFYTPTTGIWQTVWLEPVAKSHIEDLRIIPEVDASRVIIVVDVNGASEGQKVQVIASADGKEVARASGKPGDVMAVNIPNPRLWWPGSPFLYDLKVTLDKKDGDAKSGDSISSYFGLRKISVAPDEKGMARIMLNNKPVFQNGFLDQGFWPDGIYTAPTDEALKFDLEALKKFNYNMDRKHIKVEPDRWYYWADKLGVLVWQDMPAAVEMSFPPNKKSIPDREGNYESELRRMVRGRRNHPCIVMWIMFNEGWGLQLKDRKSNKDKVEAAPEARAREERMVNATRAEDSTRLINAESGAGGGGNDHGEDLWDFGLGDVIDYHCYGHDGPIAEKKRAGIVGEYGWGLAPVGALEARMKSSKGADISGCVVTQLTDVENEHNGALDYERHIVRNVALDKDVPGGISRVLREYGYTDYPGMAIAAPTMSRDEKGTVALADATPDIIIGYTLDGSDPDRSAGEYLAPIDLSHGGVVKARAFAKDHKEVSAAVTEKFDPLPGQAALPSTLVPVTQSRNWASYEWPKRHHEVCDAVRDRKPQVIFFGDSITHNFNRLIWDRAYERYHAVNAGFGWDRTENVLWRIQHGELNDTSPAVVVVMIGTNNMDLNTPPEIAAGVEAICQEIHTRQPKVKILLLGIFPRGEKPDATREKVTQTNKLLAKFDGHDGVTFLDISQTFVEPDGTISKDVLQDYLHPSRKGYVMWVDAIQPTLSRLLGEAAPPPLSQAKLPPTDLSDYASSLLDVLGPTPGDLPTDLQLKPGDQIVAMGDSITQDGGYLRDVNAILAAQSPELKLPKIINVGISGQKAEDMIRRFQRDVVNRKPAFVTLSVGTNDVMHRLGAPHDENVLAAYTQNVTKMVDMAQSAGIKVILITPATIQEEPDAEGNQRMVMYIAAERKIAAEKKCALVDLRSMFFKVLATKPAGLTERWLTRDGVHMKPRGDALMAVGILEGLGVPQDKIRSADSPSPR